MKRRELLKHVAGSGVVASLPCSRLYAAPEDYTGRFFVTIQAMGAWDTTYFCDPKVNQEGEPDITRWSRDAVVQMAGNIAYAPVANNAAFFDKYYQDMLVINGIDAQTNSHTTGVLHNWSGRNSAGYPSLTAMFAAANAGGLPLSYLSFGGYSETAKLIRYTRLDDINSLINILKPNQLPWSANESYREQARLQRVLDAQQARLDRLRSVDALLPRQRFAMDAYHSARANSQGLDDFADHIPAQDNLEASVEVNTEVTSNLLTQVQMTTLAFKSGAAASADLVLDGFDTHTDHDTLHVPLLAHLTDSVDYLWTYAEEQGIAERLTVLIASDFARTPYYNSSEGKDHWPIGSAIVMEKNPLWGNRVIGSTDAGQNAVAINPSTLQPDASGTLIYPKHVHKALRTYLGFDSQGVAGDFPFNNTESMPFFI